MIDWANWDFRLPAITEGNKTRRARCTPIQPELQTILESFRGSKGPIIPSEAATIDASTLTRAFQGYARRPWA